MQSIIGHIGIFMICAQAIMHFRPKEIYGKYLRLLFGVMVLIQILQPFLSFFFGGTGMDISQSVQEFQSIVDKSMEEAIHRAAASEEQLERMSFEEMKSRVEAQEAEDIIIVVDPIEQISISP